MTYCALSRPAGVATACPAGRRPIRSTIRLQASRMAGPPARWIAPSTPPPPSREELAAFTMASVRSRLISPGPVTTRRRSASDTRRTCGLLLIRLLVAQGFHSGQLLTLEEFQRSAAPGGDVRDLVGHPGSFHCGDTVATTDDGDGRPVVGHGVGNLLRAFGEGLDFKHAHRPVPQDSASAGDLGREQFHRL